MAEKSEAHKGYTISWQEPPETTAGYNMNIASNDISLQTQLEKYMGRKGAYIVRAQPPADEALKAAKKFIDDMFDGLNQ